MKLFYLNKAGVPVEFESDAGHEIKSECPKCNGVLVYGIWKCHACGMTYQRKVIGNDPLVTRLKAAELLLQQAEIVIEILKGDAVHESASEVLAVIENHWRTYPESI